MHALQDLSSITESIYPVKQLHMKNYIKLSRFCDRFTVLRIKTLVSDGKSDIYQINLPGKKLATFNISMQNQFPEFNF